MLLQTQLSYSLANIVVFDHYFGENLQGTVLNAIQLSLISLKSAGLMAVFRHSVVTLHLIHIYHVNIVELISRMK